MVKKDIWDADYHKAKVKKEDLHYIPGRFRGSIRFQLGLLATDEDLEKKKKRVFGRLLNR